MNDDSLRQLLRSADAGDANVREADAATLAAGVLRRHARRQAMTRIATGSTLAIVLAASVLWQLPRTPEPHLAANVEPPALPIRVTPHVDDAARTSVELHEKTIALLLSAEQRRAAQRKLAQVTPPPDPKVWAEQQRAEAALTLVRTGDRLRNDHQMSSAAAVEYRRAIELFPDTPAAAVAARRLGA